MRGTHETREGYDGSVFWRANTGDAVDEYVVNCVDIVDVNRTFCENEPGVLQKESLE